MVVLALSYYTTTIMSTPASEKVGANEVKGKRQGTVKDEKGMGERGNRSTSEKTALGGRHWWAENLEERWGGGEHGQGEEDVRFKEEPTATT